MTNVFCRVKGEHRILENGYFDVASSKGEEYDVIKYNCIICGPCLIRFNRRKPGELIYGQGGFIDVTNKEDQWILSY